MQQQNITIQQAIRKGLHINMYSWVIVAVSFVVMIGLFFEHVFGYAFLVLITGILLSVMYNSRATQLWRIWAYRGVADIHQLQRSAEISGVLSIHTYNKIPSILGAREAGELSALLQRFDEEQLFADDPSIPYKTTFYADASTRILFALCDDGIEDINGRVLPWDKIWNDHVAMTGTLRSSTTNHGFTPESTGVGPYHFRFDSEFGFSDYQVAWLNTEPWIIDLLLYIYRGRYTANRK